MEKQKLYIVLGLLVALFLILWVIQAPAKGSAAQNSAAYVPQAYVVDLATAGSVTALSPTNLQQPVLQLHNDSAAAQIYLKCTTNSTPVTAIAVSDQHAIHISPGQTFDFSRVGFGLPNSQLFDPKACKFIATGTLTGHMRLIYATTASGF